MLFKKIPLYILALITCAAVLGFINADTDPIKKATAQLEKWLDTYPQEKLYLHFDKPYYAAGDDIWFKAYVTVGARHQLSALSGALNVELIDGRDSVLQAIKLPVVAGLSNGDFALSDTLDEGNYRIRAYTNWMRNAGPNYFFDKTIHIVKSSGNVFTHTTYSYTTQNGQPVVHATVNYTNIDAAPYANKEVTYQVMLGAKTTSRGKGTTDAKGNINIVFAGNALQAQINNARVITKIKIDEKTTATKALPVTALSGKVDVQFFPESGNLVNGLPAKIAFKALGADGLGKNVTGVVVDNNNNEISAITTQHLGMGLFTLVPEAGKSYIAQITFNDGSKGTFALPKALNQGYMLSVNNTYDPENISVRIAASPELVGTEVNLIAQSAGNIYYAAKSKVENGIIATKIPKSRFPTGVTQLTLFNAAGDAVNERLIFTTANDGLKINLPSVQGTYAPREKMALQISAMSPDDKPAMASLSAAVIDETRIPVDESDETTILSTILLSSDIKGYIEKPNYYFAHNADKQAQADLDVLMLTQGYRRFEWKQLMNDSFAAPPVYKPETSLQVSGRVHNGNKPVVGGKVTLFTTAGGAFVLDTLTDASGHFEFKNLLFKDSVKFVIQARDAKGKKNVDVDLDNVSRQPVTPNINTPDIDINFNDKVVPYLQSSRLLNQQQVKFGVGNHNILLKEVTIREKKKPLVDHSSNLNGAGSADQVLKGDIFETMGCPDITQCLQGRLLGVVFRGGKAYSTRNVKFGSDGAMQIIVDGIYVDSDFLTSINYADISSIEVLRSGMYTAIYGSRGGNGVIIVNTKRGNEGSTVARFSPGVITYTPKGFYLARTFYSPQYNDPKVNATLADLRSTIHWAPNLVTDKDGKANLEFFNAGSKGTYRIVVEGIDSDGHIGRHVYRYKVE